MNGPHFVIARAAKPAAAIQLGCFVATLLAMTGLGEFIAAFYAISRSELLGVSE
jgi:hypothetical protein